MRFQTLATGVAFVATAAISALQPAAAADIYGRLDLGAAFSSNAGGNIYNGTGFGQNFGSSAVFGFGLGAPIVADMGGGIGLRGELEARWHPNFSGDHTATNPNNSIVLATTTNVETWTVMGNLYADFVRDAWRPFVGAGIGVAVNSLDPLTYTSNSTTIATETGTSDRRFAWSLMAGLGYQVEKHVTMELEYKYLDAGKVFSGGHLTLVNGTTSVQPPVASRLKAHELTMGFRIGF